MDCCFRNLTVRIYRGKRVRLTAMLKTLDIVGECGLVLRVMDAHQKYLFGQNTFDIDSEAEHDWLKREIVVDVPVHAGVLMASLELTGEGSAWINDPVFEIVDQDVPRTISNWKTKPRNLDLSQVYTTD